MSNINYSDVDRSKFIGGSDKKFVRKKLILDRIFFAVIKINVFT